MLQPLDDTTSRAATPRVTCEGCPNHPIDLKRRLAALACEPGVSVAVSKHHYGCTARKDRRTCPGVLAPRGDTDARRVEIIRGDLLTPEALTDMQRQAHEIAKTQRKETRQLGHRAAEAELAGLQAAVENYRRMLENPGIALQEDAAK
jgi:transposase-like protein